MHLSFRQPVTIVGLCIVKQSSLARLQTLIAIKDKELKLMKKKLLFTTALVAAFTATNAYAKIIDTLPVPDENGFQGWINPKEDHTGRAVALTPMRTI